MEFNPKVAGIISAIAFILSFLIGLISPASVGTVFLRALAFALVFFIIGAISNIIFIRLLSTGETDEAPPPDSFDNGEQITGSRVDLSLGGDEYGNDADDPDSAGSTDSADNGQDENIDSASDNDFPPEGLEQSDEVRYNPAKDSLIGQISEEDAEDGEAGFVPDVPGFVPGMPGIDRPEAAESESPSSPPQVRTGTVEMSVRKKSGKEIRLSDLGRDVDGKKVAGAIQTLLRKDEG